MTTRFITSSYQIVMTFSAIGGNIKADVPFFLYERSLQGVRRANAVNTWGDKDLRGFFFYLFLLVSSA